jgi:hypothetical protein
LTYATAKKDIVDDHASSAGRNRGNADVPGRLKSPPLTTDLNLPAFADSK